MWIWNYIQLKQAAKLKRIENQKNKIIQMFIDIFCVWSKRKSKSERNIIFKHNLLEYKCWWCWISKDYNWKEISLQLDHIDWDVHNHSLSNLRFLCPNCYSQTDTYWSKKYWRIHKKNTWKVDNDVKKLLDKFFPWWSEKEQFKKYL